MNTRKTKNSRLNIRSAENHSFRFGFALLSCIGLAITISFFAWRQSLSLPNFTDLDTDERKLAFFDYLAPMVEEVNGQVLSDRQIVQEFAELRESGSDLSWFEQREVASLADKYEIDRDGKSIDELLVNLAHRADVIPASLVLIQAAKESGWGTSRFAIEGNNLFGQRCYENACGIAPRGREDPGFGLAAFKSAQAAIDSYALNLNTHPKYQRFREMRQSLRMQNKQLSGLELAQGLLAYSERGQAYVDEIRAMIRQNDLD